MIKTRLIRLLDHAKKYVILQIIWKWISLLAQIVLIYCLAHMMADLYDGETAHTLLYIAGILIMTAVRFVSDRLGTRASWQASVDVKRILRGKIYDKLLKLGASYRSYVRSSEIVQMASEGVEQLETYFGKYLSQFAYALLAPLTLFAVLSFVNMRSALILLVAVPLIPVSIMAVMKIARRLLDKYFTVYYGLADSFLENLQGMTTLKTYQADEMKAEEMDRESEHFRRITMKVLTMQLNSTSIMDIIAYGGAAIGMVTALKQFQAGAVDLAGALMIILLAAEFFLPMRILGSYFHIAMNGMTASDRIFALLDLEEPVSGTETMDGYAVEIHDLKYTYQNPGVLFEKKKKKTENTEPAEEAREVLHGIDLTCPQNGFISLVGVSGCGKSTIAGILAGINRNYEGSVKVGQKELSSLSEEDRMKHITLVSHDSYLFKGTVRDNLLMADPQADDQAMIEALEKVNLWGYLKTQNGLDTKLSEGASDLSGGQRQRLAIARALLHHAEIYIMDEATSNIDMESEEQIMNVIRGLKGTASVILISHRLENVVDSDRICFLENGMVTEQGTHEELMKFNGAYRKLYTEQKELESYGKEAAV